MIINELQAIFREIFDNGDMVITRETTADDVEAWDSLTHLQLIMEIEQAFKIKFKTSQLKNMPNVGAMIDAIEELRNK
ncbi:acyl carrier protein [Lachnospiraceae bacterium C7]|nr:acyl carrier protein [Lachnospiraceae bacterium C7]